MISSLLQTYLIRLHTALNLSLGQSDSFGFLWGVNPGLLFLFPLTYVLPPLTERVGLLRRGYGAILLGLLLM